MNQPATTRRQLLATAAAAAVIGAAGSALGSPAVAAGHRNRARAMLRKMSVEDKVGQLFVVEVNGQTSDQAHPKNEELFGVSTPEEIITKYRPGGVIYFDARRGSDNLREPRQVARLSNGLQRAALRTGARVPLHVSTDQEGGSVVYRMLEPATQLPGNMALAAGALDASTDDVRRAAEIIGAELAAMGINQNYAPVADVNVNPDNPVIGVRSFGENPDLCSSLVSAAIRGYHDGDTATAAKHFPGHGDTNVDSHYGLPEIPHTREELEELDLPPFRAAIARGVDTIMTAHIVVPALDSSGAPATMSRPIITGLLREELGYDGLIVTDALDMAGASEEFPPDVAPVRALKAGVDQLVLAPEMDTAHAAVLAAVRSGEISAERLNASVLRILEHKLRRGLFPKPYVDEERAARLVGSEAHLRDAAAITDRTMTLVRNENGTLPLSGTERRVLVTGWGGDRLDTLAGLIAKRPGQRTTTLDTGNSPTEAVISEAVQAAGEHDLVVVLSNLADGGSDKGAAQATLVRSLTDSGTPTVAVGVRNPYDVNRFPKVPAYLATFSYGPPTLVSLARALYGDITPGGKLPVTIPTAKDPAKALYPYGHGLTY
ncbi:glycoside hydrolase family 3 protein [Streptomyces sp. AJS327]|uniref:glycoside hydrolase family 3 protein n=1 Tax=Streptomyces sp. AJS327 TaxID=2545265 RepID=UPI0015DE969F|nr:glycoside hydrolase family 3 protein [Streptomyces sp. AJS327]MBA0050171.1 glycoside hydrolase family 3 protein [Streptomyces sp. AJS327]